MLKEKEKRTLLIVILGISLVSLVAGLIGGIVSGIMYLVNGEMLDYADTEHLEIVYGAVLFAGMALGVAYLACYLAKKNYRSKSVLGLLFTQVAYFVLSALGIFLWMILEEDLFGVTVAEDLYIIDFSYFESYIGAMLTVLISSVLITLASHFLHKSNEKEESLEVIND